MVAFTAAQIPGIDDRTYPASLAGPLYPDGIPIVAEDRMPDVVAGEQASTRWCWPTPTWPTST